MQRQGVLREHEMFMEAQAFLVQSKALQHLTSAALLLHWLSECPEPVRTRGCLAIAAAICTSSIM